ncbi:SGNH/GDSL hydrolase family protein [Candidatus Venteria ishoeyi]|uniref:Acyl-CoA thioesterase I n=1 Tax=Candidatus Venteria ishoeyi TaxID=1899563 RepID=A0A1H6FIB2_9GAMM|nr:hypothetical protein [Candidatus Venteria ishoeyi]MDM8545558.1 hypothetical protein [Candidatus Venteria ishoeyi]SEH08866.1 Acyl-CoA thioesterase I precursor [Candidatus Venteria ishoeyi]
MKSVFHISLLFSLIFLTACGTSVPELPALDKEAVILAFGDNLTLGAHVPTAQTYPAQLQSRIPQRVINAGLDGEDLAVAGARLSTLLKQHQPKILLLCHSGYQSDEKDDGVQTVEYFRQLINTALQHQVSVVLIGFPGEGKHRAPPHFYRRMGRAFKIPYHGAVLGRIYTDIDKMDKQSNLPNAGGYQFLAEELEKLLRKTGALPELSS